MKNLVKNGFDKLSIPNLLALAELVIAQMALNVAYFPLPTPSLPALQDDVDELKSAAAESAGGDKFKKLVTQQKKAALVDDLQKEGMFVNICANGSRNVAARSSFPLIEEYTKQYIQPMSGPTLKLGAQRGDIVATTPSQKGMKACAWYITTDSTLPLSKWSRVNGGDCKNVFTNLQPGTVYYVYVVMKGSWDQEFTSPVSSLMA
jgi:hypothetical protein